MESYFVHNNNSLYQWQWFSFIKTIKSKCANTKTKYQIVFVLFAAVWKTIERKNKKEERSKRQITKTQSFCKLFDTEKQYDIEVQITFIYIEKVSKKKPHIKTQ